ncbi:MAG: FkbM family methyltransferase, partial [Nanoarchaeota archaeon]
TFDNFDIGNIDVLYLDCEGCEFFVLEKMISRPIMINLRFLPQFQCAPDSFDKSVGFIKNLGYTLSYSSKYEVEFANERALSYSRLPI